MPDLETLLVAVSHGDEAAFEEFYSVMRPRVHGLVLRTLRDPHHAEEVTQEVFFELWRTSGRFDPLRGSAPAWTLRVAHRRAVDRVRTNESWRRRDMAAARDDYSTPFDQTSEEAHRAFDASALGVAMGSLSTRQREALDLFYRGDNTGLDVSRVLQVPLGTVKSRLRDGVIRLRVLLATDAQLAD